MKVKIILAAAALIVVGAQIHYTLSQKNQGGGEPATEATVPATPDGASVAAERSRPAGPSGADEPAAADEAAVTENAAPVPEPTPTPESVTGIRISVGEAEAVRLTDGERGWVISSLDAAPADSERIVRFLDGLLLASRQPPLNADEAITGLGEGCVTVRLALASADAYTVRLGLRPDGDYHSTFAAFGQEPPVVLQADLRGCLGLWRNIAGETPEPAAWALTRPFRFEPEDVTKVAAHYPDHEIAFERGPAGDGWTAAGHNPGGKHDSAAIDRWLTDLAAFTVTGVAGAASAGPAQPVVSLTLATADGGTRKMDVFRSPDGAGMRVRLDAHPGLEFALPDWRYGKYFLRMAELFPDAVPRFDIADIRLIDLRHGGESAKIARRDGEWRLVGLPYALRPERVERLARLAAGLAPEDYADTGLMPARAAAGGPVLEVVLADGTMRQYRLGGRHPMFAWRYVAVDSGGVLSLPESAAEVLFPKFGEVLALGTVFPGLDAADLTGAELIRAEDGARLLSIRREEGVWTAGNERGEVALTQAEAEAIAEAPAGWRVADFSGADAAADGREGMMRLRLTGAGGMERGITLLAPQGRDIPYIADGGRAFLLNRSDFFPWLGAVRALGRRIDAAAEEAEAKVEVEVEEKPTVESPAELESETETEAKDVPAQSKDGLPER